MEMIRKPAAILQAWGARLCIGARTLSRIGMRPSGDGELGCGMPSHPIRQPVRSAFRVPL